MFNLKIINTQNGIKILNSFLNKNVIIIYLRNLVVLLSVTSFFLIEMQPITRRKSPNITNTTMKITKNGKLRKTSL